MFDVVTFGSAVIDIFVDTEFKSKGKVVSYEAGSKILVDNIVTDIGGGATNTAVAFARFGYKTGCIAKIGMDNAGSEILSMLYKEKVKFLGSIEKGKSTGQSIILDSKDRERTILTYKGPGNDLTINEIPKFKTKWLYYSSVLGESLKTQIKLAEKMLGGTKIAYNPSLYLVKNPEIIPLIKMSYVVIMNKEEAEGLCKANKLKGDVFKSIRSLGPKIIVITDKDNPAYAYDGEKTYSITPHKIKVVERTGAGDAFAAGFVAGLMRNWPIQKCLELALEEGESVLQYFGAKNNLIRRNLKRC